MTKHFYITTPIYYVNDRPHIGHAYTSLACDVMARFKRLDGYDVKFLTGTDEHGQKVEKSAAKAGKAPQDFVDEVSQHFREMSEAMNFSHDDFIRTSSERHKREVTKFWHKIAERGKGEGGIYLDSYAGWYSVRDEAFYAESELEKNAEGQLVSPYGSPVEWVEEPSYFFELSYWQQSLLEFYEQNPEFVYPESRYNEVKRFVESGLQDLSISRTSFNWGVPVPGDEKHVMYVWLDALYNYVSALGGPEGEEYKRFWPADIHMVGKDILRFHAVYWPAFLMAAGMPTPEKVVAHGWWTNEGQKISKSLGNVIDPYALVEEFGLDQTRYFLMREVPFGNDGDYSRDKMVSRINADLANEIGNLCQRTLSMIQKNCDGNVPERGPVLEQDEQLQNIADSLIQEMRQDLQKPDFSKALERVLHLSGAANEYITREQPWALKKTDPARMADVLYTLAEALRYIATALAPFIPNAANQMLDQLAVSPEERDFTHLSPEHALKAGTALPPPRGVFPRFLDSAA